MNNSVPQVEAATAWADDELAPIDRFRREHRTAVLVVMFTDLKGSTDLAEQRGEVYSQEVRLNHDAMLRQIIERDAGGRVIKTIGDSLMCIFAEPTLAVERAVEIQNRLDAYNREHPAEHPIRVRIGMHMGQVVVEEAVRPDVFGRHVNRAARVEGLADGGQILLTLPVYDSARGWLAQRNLKWHDHGDYKLKGIDDATRIYEVCYSPAATPKQPRGNRIESSRRRKFLLIAGGVLVATQIGVALIVSHGMNFQKRKRNQAIASRTIPEVAVVQFVENPLLDEAVDGVTAEMQQLGFALGLHYSTRRYNANGDIARLENIIHQLREDQPDVILTVTTQAMITVAQHIHDIPTVFTVASDPRLVGVFKEGHRPANLVGVHDNPPLAQLLDLANERLGNLKVLGTVWNANAPNAKLSASRLRDLCESRNVKFLDSAVVQTDELQNATSRLCRDGAQLIVVSADNLTTTGLPLILDAARIHSVPVYSTEPGMVKRGVDAAIGDDYQAWGRQSARLLAKVLRGTRPDQLPLEETIVRRTVIHTDMKKDLP